MDEPRLYAVITQLHHCLIIQVCYNNTLTHTENKALRFEMRSEKEVWSETGCTLKWGGDKKQGHTKDMSGHESEVQEKESKKKKKKCPDRCRAPSNYPFPETGDWERVNVRVFVPIETVILCLNAKQRWWQRLHTPAAQHTNVPIRPSPTHTHTYMRARTVCPPLPVWYGRAVPWRIICLFVHPALSKRFG